MIGESLRATVAYVVRSDAAFVRRSSLLRRRLDSEKPWMRDRTRR